MGKSSAFDADVLKLLFNATPIANVADNTLTSPLTNLYVALHTADPGVGGNQTTNELSYTGYARVAVARTSGGWTITGTSCSPAADVTFPTSTSAGGTATFASIGSVASPGTGKIFYSGTLTPNIGPITNGMTPVVKAGSTIVET